MNKDQVKEYSAIFFDKEYVFKNKDNIQVINIINLISIYFINKIKQDSYQNKIKVKSNSKYKITRRATRIIHYSCNIDIYGYFQLYFDLFKMPLSYKCYKKLLSSINYVKKYESLENRLYFMTWITNKCNSTKQPLENKERFKYFYRNSIFFKDTIFFIYKHNLISKYYPYIHHNEFYICVLIRFLIKKQYNNQNNILIDIAISKLNDLSFHNNDIWLWYLIDFIYQDYDNMTLSFFLNEHNLIKLRKSFYLNNKKLVDNYIMYKQLNIIKDEDRPIINILRLSDPFKRASKYLNLFNSARLECNTINFEFDDISNY